MLEYKKGYTHITGRKLKIIISEGLIISSELSYMIVTLGSTTCNMEGHVKLFNRLSDPSDRLIHRISHPSEEQTLVEPNHSCFICVQVHGFSVCNPQFCKKNSHATKDLSNKSSRK